jgi:nitrile hydratase
MGGMHGFGPVVRDPDERVFRAPWEGRVVAMALTTPTGVRRGIERLPPAQYLAAAYYERWLAALEAGLLAGGAVAPEELAATVAFFREHPAAPVPRRDDPAAAAAAVAGLRRHRPLEAAAGGTRPRFGVGDAVRARNLHPAGYTRLPRYARGRRGTVARVHGVHAVADDVSGRAGAPAGPQPVYAVRFAARELWGDDGHRRDAVHVDLWESHLEPA